MQRVHAKGRGFSYTYLPQGFYQTPAIEISSINERKRLFYAPYFENNGFHAQAGKPKTVL